MARFTTTRMLQIGDLSHRTGVNIETIRYYERIGLMPEPARTGGGNRLYDGAQLQRLSFIKRSRDLGFSINEIRELLELVGSNAFTCGEIHAIATAQIDKVRRKLADLRRLERTWVRMADACSKGDVPDCPIIDALSIPLTISPAPLERKPRGR